MLNSITLTASMRTNLASLKTIATQMNKTQNILSTGKKVNSAIDNASSYYQARALTNRASDLSALLDSMGQGIQTIQAATEGIEAGTKYLEQAKVLVDDALVNAATDTVEVDGEKTIAEQNAQRLKNATGEAPDKAWLLANGAGFVVETEAELRDALTNATAGQKIVVNGKIDVTINDVSEQLDIKEGVELVGSTALSANAINADGSYKGQLNIVNNSNCANIIARNSSKINNLTINSNKYGGSSYNIYGLGVGVSDVNIVVNSTKQQFGISFCGGQNYIKGNVNIINSGTAESSVGVYSGTGAVLDIDANLSISTVSKWGHGIQTTGGTTNVKEDSVVNIYTSGDSAMCLDSQNKGVVNIEGAELNLISEKSAAIYNESWSSASGGNTLKIKSGAEINAKAKALLRNASSEAVNPITGNNDNYMEVEAGVKVFFDNISNGTRGSYVTKETWIKSNIKDDGNKTAFNLEELKEDGWEYNGALYFSDNSVNLDNYNMILGEYDALIVDSSYQGINLLNGNSLTVTFNESRSNKFTVEGVKAKSEDLGIKTRKWNTEKDIENSLNEINSAINILRDEAGVLGNNYSIIQTRQNFTEALTDVLETGADNLVLADMNEASAEYLMLQTRQQLATNSLSLAAQSAQSILSLF